LDKLRTLLRSAMSTNIPKYDTSPGEITTLLNRLAAGEESAKNELFTLMYPELRRIAEAQMRRERADHTLQPTALVNEFFLEFSRERKTHWRDRKHIRALAAQAMRRFLIDYARGHTAARRGGPAIKLQLTDLDIPVAEGLNPIIIDELLDRLANEEPRMARVVELRCFGGLNHAEIAEILKIDERTVRRDWQVGRAWLYGQLRK
jgi:RNA polymerase sigma factor (TIGR02999 family)